MVDDSSLPRLPQGEIARRFLGADWTTIDLHLRKVSFGLLQQTDDTMADDLIQEAKMRVWAGIEKGKGRRWNPLKHPDLGRYLAWVVRSHFRNELGTPYERDRVHAEEGREHVALEPSGDAYRVLLSGGRLRRGEDRIRRTRERLDPLALAVFDEILAKTFDPAAFTAKHDLTMDEVKEARQRAKYAWKSVIESDTDADSPGAFPAVPAAGEDVAEEGES